GPGELDILPFLHDELVVAQPRLALLRQLLLADPFGHGPGRLCDEAVERRLQLWRGLVGFAGDDLATVDMLAVAPVVERGCGGVDVDPRLGRIALQPAEPLHRDGKLPGASGRARA